MTIAVDLGRKATKQTNKTNYRLMQVKSIEKREHSAILSTFNKLPFVIKIFVLSIFECPFHCNLSSHVCNCKSFIVILTIQDKVEICISLK